MEDARILLIDDKPNYLSLLERLLGERYPVTRARDGREGIALLEGRFDLVISDIKMPGADGLAVLAEAKRIDPDTEVILMTAYGSIDRAVEAMKAGAYHYLTKPFEPEELLLLVERALERRRLLAKARKLDELLAGASSFGELVGDSPAMRQVIGLLRKVAPMSVTVLLEGESGTGKEVIARAIHAQSPRRGCPFVAVNCAAIPESLLESELFGHKKGAFSGATADRAGLFEAADTGTLLLDEIGELPLSVQAKLNRALQEGEIRRVGETESRKVDVRILAATLRDLRSAVEAGQFREDLYYRLNVFRLKIPPLRERKEEIPQLVAHFLKKHAGRMGLSVPELSPAALQALLDYDFPGNVRELEHAVERALVVCEGGRITPEALPPELSGARWAPAARPELSALTYKQALELARDEMSREYLSRLFEAFGGNVARASEVAGVERESLYRLARRYSVDPASFRRG